MFKSRSTLILMSCITGALSTVLLKYYCPYFIYYNTCLLLVILFTVFLKSDLYTYMFGAFAVIMILLSLHLATNPEIHTIIKQTVNVFIAVTIMFVVLYIKKLYHSLDKEKKQMNALFEFAKESILLTNSKGKILLANPEAQRLFSYSPDEMKGHNFEMLLPERFQSAFCKFRDAMEEPSSEQQLSQEISAIKKSGKEFPVEVHFNSYKQQDELIILVFITDLSQRKEAENRFVDQKTQLETKTHDVRIMNIELENKVVERTLILQEALQDLERSQIELNDALSNEKELNEIKSRFVSMASHEFRTPLSTILSSASLLSKYQLNEQQANREKHIGRIKNSVKHLNDMLKDFLNLGKLEEGKVLKEIVVFNVKDFLEDVFDEMKINLKMGQQLKLSFDGESIFATEKRLLKDVLINLLSNAIKFSDVHKIIEVVINNSSNLMILQVKDQGIGIAKEDLPHLFSSFFRGNNAVNIQGTGLGLHIVKRYVEMLEGSITFSTELDKGTTFNVSLPNLN